MSTSKHARYHARRKQRLHARLGLACAHCTTEDNLTIAHLHGDGGLHRKAGHWAEVTRLLGLPDEELHAQIALLCWPCHEAYDLAKGYLIRF